MVRSLGEILSDLQKNAQKQITSACRAEDSAPSVVDLPACPTCNGFQFIVVTRDSRDADFGKLTSCPSCNHGARRLANAVSRLPSSLQGLSWDSLQQHRDPKHREADDLALAKVKLWSERGYPEHPWLYLAGNVGWGKTTWGATVLNERPGIFVRVPDLLANLKAGFEDNSAETRIQNYMTTGLLMLDELGVEKDTEWAHEQLYRIIDARYLERLPTIFTTNAPVEALAERLASRMLDRNICLVIAGLFPSMRRTDA